MASGLSLLDNKDCLVRVFLCLPPITTKVATEVRKLWREIILNNPYLHGSFLLGCIEKPQYHLRMAAPYYNDKVLNHIVVLHLLRGDSSSAETALGKLKDPLKKARALIEGARQIRVQMRESPKVKIEERVLPILAEAKKWLIQVKRLCKREPELLEVVKMEAYFNPALARETCNLIQESHTQLMLPFPTHTNYRDRDLALLEIIKVQVSTDLPGAEATLGAIKLPGSKIAELCKIAKYKPEALQEAKRLYYQYQESKDVDVSVRPIVIVEALYDPYQAEKTAQQENFQQDELYVQIARISFKKNPGLTKQWASEIENKNYQTRVLFEIAIMEGDLQSAIEHAKEIRAKKIILDMDIPEILIDVASINPQHDFSEATQAALDLKYPRNTWLSSIAVAEAEYDVNRAKITANKIVDAKDPQSSEDPKILEDDSRGRSGKVIAFFRSRKATTFLKIAQKDPLHDLSAMKAEACQIVDTYDRVELICNVAKTLLKHFGSVDANYDSYFLLDHC